MQQNGELMIPYRFGEDQFPTNEQDFVNIAMQGKVVFISITFSASCILKND